MNTKPFEVEFNKTFVSGNLEGLSVRECVRFAIIETANRYAKSLERSNKNSPIIPAVGNSKYYGSEIKITKR